MMLTLFALNWMILAFNVKFYEDWRIENYLTIPFLVLIYWLHRWFRFSDLSYGVMFVYMMLHIYGSHYTYAEVPFGDWMEYVSGLARNHYDRIVHFSFGFLLAYPIREVVLRVTGARGFWGLYIPIEFVLAFSAIYEILEWIVALVYGGDLGVAYLGTQGDEWDAIKDMTLAGTGSVIAIGIVMIVLLLYRGGKFWDEFKESLRVKDQAPLGEHALEEMQRRQKRS
jgi:putative membrane protein